MTYSPSSPWWNSREAARARFVSGARREEEVDAGHLRRRPAKLMGQILPADHWHGEIPRLILDKLGVNWYLWSRVARAAQPHVCRISSHMSSISCRRTSGW